MMMMMMMMMNDDDDDDDDDGFSWRSLSHSQEHTLKKKKTQQLCSTDL